jgi:hypothetical protein
MQLLSHGQYRGYCSITVSREEFIVITQAAMPFQAHEIYIIFQEIYVRKTFAAQYMN